MSPASLLAFLAPLILGCAFAAPPTHPPAASGAAASPPAASRARCLRPLRAWGVLRGVRLRLLQRGVLLPGGGGQRSALLDPRKLRGGAERRAALRVERDDSRGE